MNETWTEIVSPHNGTIKEVAKLRAERHRKRRERILIDGTREIQRAAAAGFEIESLFFCAGERESASDLEALTLLPAGHRYRVAPAAFHKMAFGDRNEGVVAVAREKQRTLDSLTLGTVPLLLVLDGIEKPGNVGAVFRTAAAAGIDAILLTNERCSPFNANAVRASLGTVFELPFVSDSPENVIRFLKRRGIRIVATRVDASTEYTAWDLNQPVALVLGSEAEGVAPVWQAFESMVIPMNRSVDSLNISATAAIVAFEAQRQRRAGLPST